MSETSTLPSNREWFRRLLSGRPHQVIGGPDDPYLLRWYVIPRNPVLNVYLHKFLRSDDDRALHDHPWWFVSLILRGRYDEVTMVNLREVRTRRNPGSIAFRAAEWRHRVELIRRGLPSAGQTWEVPCWTLIVTGRRVRTWGFWCNRVLHWGEPVFTEDARFVPWDEFGDAGCGEPQ